MPQLFKRKTFNDTLALVLLVLYVGLWVADAMNKVDVPDIVTGATITHLTMVVTFYFRKQPPNGAAGP